MLPDKLAGSQSKGINALAASDASPRRIPGPEKDHNGVVGLRALSQCLEFAANRRECCIAIDQQRDIGGVKTAVRGRRQHRVHIAPIVEHRSRQWADLGIASYRDDQRVATGEPPAARIC